MSIHQIIYTSCMRGINGVNDGQQVYSYDAAFADINNDEIKSLFTYQHPALEAGIIMSEEIAQTMPKSFTYRRLDNGACTLTLNTYLGRDYMGSAGRFGNHLSHVIVFDEADTCYYPAEYYGSDLLRTHMKFEEVNNPNKPDHLPTPVLERGFSVDIETVTSFLSVDNRLEIYKNMLYAMLAFGRERKRVVICDAPENIILWIAALEYALPLRNALNLNFTTYDYDPSLSSSQICGVVPNGTRFNAGSYNQHFVFDLLSGQYPEFELEPDFYDFIDTAMALSYESLQDFHTYICSGYGYDGVDEKLYAAYWLYSILSDGMGGINFNKWNCAINFADEYATNEEIHRILHNIMSEAELLLRGDKTIFLKFVEFTLKHAAELSDTTIARLKEIIVDRVLCEFLSEEITEAEYVDLYDRIQMICSVHSFSIADELMKKDNRVKLFSVMRYNMATWEIAFIVKVVSDCIKEQNIPATQLYSEASVGQIYSGIVRASYAQSQQNGFFAVTKILEAFSFNCSDLVNMGLFLEGIVLDACEGDVEVSAMWKYFGQLLLTAQPENFALAYSAFDKQKRYDRIHQLYTIDLSRAATPEQYCEAFEKHYQTFVVKDQAYAARYCAEILEKYYRGLTTFDASATYESKVKLFNVLLEQKVDANFADELIKDLMRPLSLEKPAREQAKLIQDIFNYTYNFRQQPVSGKLLLLLVGMVLDGVKGKKRLYEKLEQLEQLTKDNKADLSRATERGVETYLDWLLPNVCELCDRTADLEAIYNLFVMHTAVETVFFTQCAKYYLKQSKGGKDYSLFCEFLGVVLEYASSTSREEVGKILCKLSKQKLEDLDSAVNDHFRKNNQALRAWDDIRETAEKTNPLLNNISNLFKRRKD